MADDEAAAAAPEAQVAEVSPGLRGSLADLAAMGIASEPTLRRWIAAEPDRPWIIKRGSNGDAYEIDLAEAARAFRAREDEKAREARERAQSIQQLALSLNIGAGADQSTAGLSIQERRQLLEEEMLANRLAKQRGELISKASVDGAVADYLIKSRQLLTTFSARVAKKVDLERHQITAIDRQMEADLNALADMLERMEIGDADGSIGDGAAGAAAALEDSALPNGG